MNATAPNGGSNEQGMPGMPLARRLTDGHCRQVQTFSRFEKVLASMTLESIPLSGRIRHHLFKAGVYTIGELCGFTEDELIRWRNLGPTSVAKIRRCLASYGCELGTRPLASGTFLTGSNSPP